MNTTLPHNSRCARSGATSALLEAVGVEWEVGETLQTPPSAARIGRPPQPFRELFE